MPDLSFDISTNSGAVHIDAYKTTKNDQIIENNKPEYFAGLRWVN